MSFGFLILLIGGAGQAPQADKAHRAQTATSSDRPLSRADAEQVEEWKGEVAELRQAGKYLEAQATARSILTLRLRVQGETHWQTGDAKRLLQNLEKIAILSPKSRAEITKALKWDEKAAVLLRQEQADEAVALRRRSLAVRRRHLGEDNSEVADAIHALAAALEKSDAAADAEPLFREARALRRRLLEADHPATAESISGLTRNLTAQGRKREAEPLGREAIAAWQRARGEEHPATAAAYDDLAATLRPQEKYGEAATLDHQALVIRRKVLGEEHADTAVSCTHLAMDRQGQGQYTEAETLYRLALIIHRKVSGEAHLDTARAYHDLGESFTARGQHAEAEPLYRQALAVVRRVRGEDDPGTARHVRTVAANLYAQRRYAEAEAVDRYALVILSRGADKNHADTLALQHHLALALQAQGKLAEAEGVLRTALDKRRRQLGAEDPATLRSLLAMADNLEAQKRAAEAEPLLRQVLTARRTALGEKHAETAAAFARLGINLDAQGRHGDAEPLLRQALTVYRKALGDDCPETLRTHGLLALNLQARRQYAEAEIQWAHAMSRGDQTAPLPFIVLLARRGRAVEAWKQWEASLAGPLLEEVVPQLRRVTAAERDKQQDLKVRCRRLDEKLIAARNPPADHEPNPLKIQELVLQRDGLRAELARFEMALAGKYDDAGLRRVADLAHVQERLPADTALVGWIDAADDHWACVVRRQGPPVWIRLPGSGERGAWTREDERLPEQARAALLHAGEQDKEELAETWRRLYRQRLAPVEAALTEKKGLPAVRRLVVLGPEWLDGVLLESLKERYTLSYAPSATLFVWLQKRRQSPHSGLPRLLVLGDPDLDRRAPEEPPTPPPAGVFVRQVLPDSAADRAGLQAGDVLLRYGAARLSGPADLTAALQAAEQADDDTEIVLEIWRDGERYALRVGPGPLGLKPYPGSVAEMMQRQRLADEALEAGRVEGIARPGGRLEVEAIAGLFPREQQLRLLSSSASEQRLLGLLGRGELSSYRYLHLAAPAGPQGDMILAQDQLPDALQQVLVGRDVCDARLSAAKVLRTWQLNAELVTLSSGATDRYPSMAQALLLTGAHHVMVSMWPVDEMATALLMERFYRNLWGQRDGMGEGLAPAEALAEAKRWLRGLSAGDADRLVRDLTTRGRKRQALTVSRHKNADERPYSHPHYWSGFLVIGVPDY
jgi:hypothetical protein